MLLKLRALQNFHTDHQENYQISASCHHLGTFLHLFIKYFTLTLRCFGLCSEACLAYMLRDRGIPLREQSKPSCKASPSTGSPTSTTERSTRREADGKWARAAGTPRAQEPCGPRTAPPGGSQRRDRRAGGRPADPRALSGVWGPRHPAGPRPPPRPRAPPSGATPRPPPRRAGRGWRREGGGGRGRGGRGRAFMHMRSTVSLQPSSPTCCPGRGARRNRGSSRGHLSAGGSVRAGPTPPFNAPRPPRPPAGRAARSPRPPAAGAFLRDFGELQGGNHRLPRRGDFHDLKARLFLNLSVFAGHLLKEPLLRGSWVRGNIDHPWRGGDRWSA